MATKKTTKKTAVRKKATPHISIGGTLNRIVETYLHPQEVSESSWRWLPYLLVTAFILRAIVALSGDFVIHPDEIMQYLEPAHNLVFGSGVVYWEYFYGARSWLVPGVVAGILWICKLLGLDSPIYYIAAVKLFFCLIAVLVPWGMYIFSRRHWGERTARMALILGVFWYELIGFAHKPMTEFVATSLILTLLALSPMSAVTLRRAFLFGVLGTLIIAVRFQYTPVIGLILLVGFISADKRARAAMLGGSLAIFLGVALLEIFTWGGAFHSYYVNYKMNVIVGAGRAGESSPLIFLMWLFIASGGLATVMLPAATRIKQRGFILALILLALLPHMLQNHREYRFIFIVTPLWLLLLADCIVASTGLKNAIEKVLWPAAAMSYAVLISVLGIFNSIPLQKNVYQGFSEETGKVNFIINQDPVFDLYGKLANDDSVHGVLDLTRSYFNTGGYYYLNRHIPFYDISSWRDLIVPEKTSDYASHIISNSAFVPENTGVSEQGVPFLKTDKGNIRLPTFIFNGKTKKITYWDNRGQEIVLDDYELLQQDETTALWKNINTPTRDWEDYHIIAAGGLEGVMQRIFRDNIPQVPPRYGVKFKDEN